MNFTAIDFETANRQSHSACSVALTIVENNKIIDEFYTLIQPETWFDRFNTQVHGIRKEDVIDAPKFPEVWEQMAHFFTPDQLVIAHNLPFDRRVLNGTLDYYDLAVPSYKTLCTVQTSRKLLNGLPNNKLNTLARYYEIPLNHHHALDDARACAKILLYQVNEFGEEAIQSLIKT